MSSLSDKKIYLKFVENHAVYVVIRDDKVIAKLIIRFRDTKDSLVEWIDYTCLNVVSGDTLSGTVFEGHTFGEEYALEVKQLKDWGYSVVLVI